MRGFLKMFTLFLALVIGVAQASTLGSLSSLVQEYQYQMTVEWDQHDHQFAEASREQFLKGVESLKAQGLSEKDLLSELEAQVKNPATLDQMLQLKSHYVSGFISSDNFANKVLELAVNDQTQGASWNGRTTIAFSVLAVIAVAWTVWAVSICRSEGCNPRDSF